MIDWARPSSDKLPGWPWLVALASLVTFFIFSISLAYRSIGIMAENNQRITNNLQVITLIKDLKTELLNAETGQRGYLLTEDVQYLEPYHEALGRINQLLSAISSSDTELQRHQSRFTLLHTQTEQIINGMQAVVQLVHNDLNRVAVIEINTDTGIELMRSVLALLREMETDEQTALEQNRTSADHTRKLILAALIATNVVGLLLALGIYIVVYRNARNVAALYAEIEEVNTELESKVQQRTLALRQYSDDLKRSNRDLEQFAFVASHDLQEPLRKIHAFGDRLLQKYGNKLDESGSDYLVRMQNASRRMSEMIDDLLSFSRITTQKKPFSRVKLDKLMANVLDDLEYAIENARATVRVDELPEIDADASQIRQVFMNLIGNSIKFRQPDVKPEIVVTCETDTSAEPSDGRRWYNLSFADNGVGFDPLYEDRVFDLFQRLHGRDKYEGTGIGLALCRKVIDRHGGTISAESAPGKGTVFSIRLPANQSSDSDFSA